MLSISACQTVLASFEVAVGAGLLRGLAGALHGLAMIGKYLSDAAERILLERSENPMGTK